MIMNQDLLANYCLTDSVYMICLGWLKNKFCLKNIIIQEKIMVSFFALSVKRKKRESHLNAKMIARHV